MKKILLLIVLALTAQFTLRHSNPATTQIYTATLNEERRLQNSGEALIDNLY
jgi:hypothetical protein